MYNNFYPMPRLMNIIAAPFVPGVAGGRQIPQNEVALKLYDPLLLASINKIIKQSQIIGGYPEIEVGFFCFITDKNPVVSFVTSNEEDRIFSKDLDKAFEACASQISGVNIIQRVQFYHTHSRGVSSNRISSLDIKQAKIKAAEVYTLTKRRVPFDMHALPIEMSKEGVVKFYNKPPLGKPTPPEYKDAHTVNCGHVLLRATI